MGVRVLRRRLGDPGLEFGDLPATVGHPREYFDRLGVVLDCRGSLVISPSSRWGFRVTVLTASHLFDDWPRMGEAVDYGVRVDDEAWVCSHALLAGCVVGARSIVAAGAVVRGQVVAPGVMVAGNPARVVARWSTSGWRHLPARTSGYARDLA